ncbi:ArsR/SmtB family transcription factor [Rudaeicoccus suwonensis]|nr:winged helix-turn-helix domain-containing protein [Rudaeicoccus suwonensis]
MSSLDRSMPRLTTGPDLSVVGRALADTSRSQMLTGLLTGTAWTVGELASYAGVARSTASEHVGHLSAAGLVRLVRQGRHTYVSLAGPEVAAALESLSLIAPDRPPVASLRGQRHARELAAGRTCYRHLAGAIGVRFADHLLDGAFIDEASQLTHEGCQWFIARGIDITADVGNELIRPCMDWTERRPHLAGTLMDRVTAHALAHDWIVRTSHPRSVRLTDEGERQMFSR